MRDRLSAWLGLRKCDQKRDDAMEMLEAIRSFDMRRDRIAPVNFSFEWTENWANAPWRIEAAADAEAGDGDGSAILDELRLEGSYRQVRRESLLRSLAAAELERAGSVRRGRPWRARRLRSACAAACSVKAMSAAGQRTTTPTPAASSA